MVDSSCTTGCCDCRGSRTRFTRGGGAIASDKILEVQIWIDEALITKPSTAQIGEWNTQPAKRFNTLIIQPYVLVQEKAAA